MPSQLRAKRFILTFPQNSTSKETVLERLLLKFPEEVENAIVAQEKHSDGEPHLHCLISFKERKCLPMNGFDFLADKHGNYQPVHSFVKSVEYVTKDKDYVSHNIDPVAFLDKKTPKSEKIAKLCQEGKTLSEIDEEHSGFVLNNKRKIQEYIQFQKEKKQREIPVEPREYIIDEFFTLKIGTPLPFRSKQLYLYGEPGIGKTTLIRKLCEKHRGFCIPTNNDFQHYDDDLYDFAFIDEFKGQLTVQFLNQFLDGQRLPLNTKGSTTIKNKNIPVIILSNHNLCNVYKSETYIDSLVDRLHIIEVKRSDIEKIISLF